MDLVPVEVDCTCPAGHGTDTVYLIGEVDVQLGVAAMAAASQVPGTGVDWTGAMAPVFLHHGIRRWTLTEGTGKDEQPLELTFENIDARITWANGAFDVARRATELYMEAVVTPFVRRMQRDSASGQTESLTSPTPPPGSTTDSSEQPSLRAVSGGKRSVARAS